MVKKEMITNNNGTLNIDKLVTLLNTLSNKNIELEAELYRIKQQFNS